MWDLRPVWHLAAPIRERIRSLGQRPVNTWTLLRRVNILDHTQNPSRGHSPDWDNPSFCSWVCTGETLLAESWVIRAGKTMLALVSSIEVKRVSLSSRASFCSFQTAFSSPNFVVRKKERESLEGHKVTSGRVLFGRPEPWRSMRVGRAVKSGS